MVGVCVNVSGSSVANTNNRQNGKKIKQNNKVKYIWMNNQHLNISELEISAFKSKCICIYIFLTDKLIQLQNNKEEYHYKILMEEECLMLFFLCSIYYFKHLLQWDTKPRKNIISFCFFEIHIKWNPGSNTHRETKQN